MPASLPLATAALLPLAEAVETSLRAAGVRLTLGGEPTLVPFAPEGLEWNVAAVGPTKLRYAYELAAELIRTTLPDAFRILSPGKQYPGELNPRWFLSLLWNRDGSLLLPARSDPDPELRPPPPAARALPAVRRRLAAAFGFPADSWLPAGENARVPRAWVLPLDHDEETGWRTDRWEAALVRPPPPAGASRAKPPRRPRGFLPLVNAEGPAGLRLPLGSVPAGAVRRALTLEADPDGGTLRIFLPPLLQAPWLELLTRIVAALEAAGVRGYQFDGYVPADDAGRWHRLGLAADPGVLEINLPPCERWEDYARWLHVLETAGAACGLRSWKTLPDGAELGTGGGNHLVFGGPSLDENPFFTRPAWLAALLGYFQAHPCLAYAFTGQYVGPSSQAPRPDESARDLSDLEMAYRHFASLPTGEDHRWVMGETLRHLHVDVSGNTHRSEVSFDKFWNLSGPPSGAAGLVEFRSLESLPRAEWMSLVALLWQAIAAHSLELSRRGAASPSLTRHGSRLHDAYFLPTPLWEDLSRVLGDLRAGGFDLEENRFRPLWDWRFPVLLLTAEGLEIRRACEGWPLLSEEPLEGGATSRFVDTSIERLEFSADPEFARRCRVFVNGRELRLNSALGVNRIGCGLRYRRTALHPSLHPGIAPHLPLEIALTDAAGAAVRAAFRLEAEQRIFAPAAGHEKGPDPGAPCQRSSPELLTYDLRLPPPDQAGGR